jgi:hypothetical protein
VAQLHEVGIFTIQDMINAGQGAILKLRGQDFPGVPLDKRMTFKTVRTGVFGVTHSKTNGSSHEEDGDHDGDDDGEDEHDDEDDDDVDDDDDDEGGGLDYPGVPLDQRMTFKTVRSDMAALVVLLMYDLHL